MNTTLKIGKFALGAVVGSLLWAGCASAPQQQGRPAMLEQTLDLQNTGPNVRPEWQATGDQFNNAINIQPWDVEAIQ